MSKEQLIADIKNRKLREVNAVLFGQFTVGEGIYYEDNSISLGLGEIVRDVQQLDDVYFLEVDAILQQARALIENTDIPQSLISIRLALESSERNYAAEKDSLSRPTDTFGKNSLFAHKSRRRKPTVIEGTKLDIEENLYKAYREEQEKIYTNWKTTFLELAAQFRRILSNKEVAPIINDLLILFPVYRRLAPYNDTIDQTNRIAEEEADDWEFIIAGNSSCNENRSQRLEKIKKRASRTPEQHEMAYLWGRWLGFLKQVDEDVPFLDEDNLRSRKNYYEKMSVIIGQYYKELETSLQELHIQRDRLSDIFNVPDMRNGLVEIPLQAREISDSEGQMYFPLDYDGKYNSFHKVFSFTDLMVLELRAIKKRGRVLAKCRLCGKLFVPYQEKSKFCSYPNAEHNNAPCNRCGPNITAYKDSFVDRERKKLQDKFYKWKEYHLDDERLQKYQKLIGYYSGISNEQKRAAWVQKEIQRVKDEVNAAYDDWVKQSRAAVERFKLGEIDEATCLELIRIPNYEEICPDLEAWERAAK